MSDTGWFGHWDEFDSAAMWLKGIDPKGTTPTFRVYAGPAQDKKNGQVVVYNDDRPACILAAHTMLGGWGGSLSIVQRNDDWVVQYSSLLNPARLTLTSAAGLSVTLSIAGPYLELRGERRTIRIDQDGIHVTSEVSQGAYGGTGPQTETVLRFG